METHNEIMNEGIYASYQCPLCGRELMRDASVFLRHAKKHILIALRKAHPEWSPEGSLAAYRNYFENQFPH